MEKHVVYRYVRPDGGVTVSPVKPDREYTELCRLIADENKVLTDGTRYSYCVDSDTPDEWSEVADGGDPEEATTEDYLASLREMGVKL